MVAILNLHHYEKFYWEDQRMYNTGIRSTHKLKQVLDTAYQLAISQRVLEASSDKDNNFKVSSSNI